MAEHPDFYAITGGPGSGKNTLIDALSAMGFHHIPEAGRAIICDQLAIDGTALPWADRGTFAELMLGWELRSWYEAQNRKGPVIFDRGVPDVSGYLRLCGLPVPAHVTRAAKLRAGQRQLCAQSSSATVKAPAMPGRHAAISQLSTSRSVAANRRGQLRLPDPHSYSLSQPIFVDFFLRSTKPEIHNAQRMTHQFQTAIACHFLI